MECGTCGTELRGYAVQAVFGPDAAKAAVGEAFNKDSLEYFCPGVSLIPTESACYQTAFEANKGESSVTMVDLSEIG